MIWVTLARERPFLRAISAWSSTWPESRRAFHSRACWRSFFTLGVKPGRNGLFFSTLFPFFADNLVIEDAFQKGYTSDWIGEPSIICNIYYTLIQSGPRAS